MIDHVELKQSNSSEPLEMPEIARHFMKIDQFERLDIHCLLMDFKVKYPNSKCIDKFLEFSSKAMKKSLCEAAQIKTQDQYAAPTWKKLRYYQFQNHFESESFLLLFSDTVGLLRQTFIKQHIVTRRMEY